MSPFCFRPAFDLIEEVGFTGIAVGEIWETGLMIYKLELAACLAPAPTVRQPTRPEITWIQFYS